MTTKWIKPSELPDDFWGECFVASRLNFAWMYPEIKMLKKVDGAVFIYMDYDDDRGWLELGEDTREEKTRVMIIERPTISEEDFK